MGLAESGNPKQRCHFCELTHLRQQVFDPTAIKNANNSASDSDDLFLFKEKPGFENSQEDFIGQIHNLNASPFTLSLGV
jgi:hypothetical protein